MLFRSLPLRPALRLPAPCCRCSRKRKEGGFAASRLATVVCIRLAARLCCVMGTATQSLRQPRRGRPARSQTLALFGRFPALRYCLGIERTDEGVLGAAGPVSVMGTETQSLRKPKRGRPARFTFTIRAHCDPLLVEVLLYNKRKSLPNSAEK